MSRRRTRPQKLGWRARLAEFLDHPVVTNTLIALIALNAIVLGMEAIPSIAARHLSVLHLIDNTLLAVFTLELALKLIALGPSKFFRDPWCIFDFVVIGISLIPASEAFSVLRAMRILRALRIVSKVPSMRRVVIALLTALPGMGSIMALLALVIYVAAVMATKLFAEASPEFFGDLGKSIFTLFQIMTVEGWPDIARETMGKVPYAWIFFVTYLVCATFTVLNLFIAVIVNAMQSQFDDEKGVLDARVHADQANRDDVLLAEIQALRAEVLAMKSAH